MPTDPIHMRWVLRALLSHWGRHKLQLAALMVGLAAATALWSGVQALNDQARQSYDAAAQRVSGLSFRMLVPTDPDAPISEGDFRTLRALGWPVSPIVDRRILIDGTSYRLMGIEPLTLPQNSDMHSVAPGAVDLLPFIEPPYQAVVSPQTARRLSGNTDLPPRVESTALADRFIIMDIGAALAMPDATGLTGLVVAADFDANTDRLPPNLRARIQLLEPLQSADIGALTDSFHLNLTAFGLLSFLVGLFIVYGAIGLSFEDRKPLFRTLRLCGVSARRLSAALIMELLGFAVCAAVVGMLGGALMASVLLPDLSLSLSGLYGADIGDSLRLRPLWWVAGAAISILGALGAAATALWRTHRMPVTHLHQPRAQHGAYARQFRWQAAAASGIALIGVGGLTLWPSLAGGFAAMAALLVASALVLPALLWPLVGGLARLASGPIARWFWSDARSQIGAMSLALMALLLALGASIGVGAMVNSFRITFDGFLDERLAAELYFIAASDRDGARLAEALHARSDVRAVLPDWRARARIGGWPVDVVAFADHATTRETWTLLAALATPWDRVQAGAVLVNEQLAHRFSLAPGDTVTLETETGLQSYTIAGVYADYGNTTGQIRGDVGVLAARFPRLSKAGFAVRTDTPAAVMAFLEQQGLDPARMIDQRQLKAFSKSVFEQTFVVTTALNALTLLVAGTALLTNLLTLSAQRLVSLAPLWAMGLTRRHLAVLDLAKTVCLALLTAVLAIPLGIGVAWLLVAVINVEAFGWRLPLGVYPADWVRLAAMVLITTLVAGLWPAWKLGRVTPARLAKVFADAR